MEIEESKVNAELSQVRDIYVWVTTVYFGPNQTCFVQHHVGGACTTTYTWNASLNIVFDRFLGLFSIKHIYSTFSFFTGKSFDSNYAYIEVSIHAEGLESTREAFSRSKRLLLGGYNTGILMDSKTNLEDLDGLIFF